jgi:hypothetical protein
MDTKIKRVATMSFTVVSVHPPMRWRALKAVGEVYIRALVLVALFSRTKAKRKEHDMKSALFAFLGLFAFPVMAATPAFSLEGFVWFVVGLVVVAIVFGLLHLLVGKAPIDGVWKTWIQYLILAVGILILIIMLIRFAKPFLPF